MEEQTQTKKSRSLPRVWARFWRLNRGDMFTHPRKDVLVSKLGLFTFSTENNVRQHIWPWTRVRTTTFVRDVLKGGKSAGAPVTEAAEMSYQNEGVRTARLNDRRNVKTPAEVANEQRCAPFRGTYVGDHEDAMLRQTEQTGPSA